MAEKPAAAPAEKAEPQAKKANAQLQAIIKNQFWILSGIVAVTCLAVWYFGVDALDLKFAEGKQQIDGAYSTLESMQRTVNSRTPNAAPNADFSKAIDLERDKQTQKVLEAWWELFDRQARNLVGPLPPATEMHRTGAGWVKKVEVTQMATTLKVFPHGPEVTLKFAKDAVVKDAAGKDLPKPVQLALRVNGAAIITTASQGNETVIQSMTVYTAEDFVSSYDWESTDLVSGTRAKIRAVDRKADGTGAVTLLTAGPEISFPLTNDVAVVGARGETPALRFDTLKPADDLIYLKKDDATLEAVYEQLPLFSVSRRVPMFQDLVLKSPAERPTLGAATSAYVNNRVLEEDFDALFSLLDLRHEAAKTVFGEGIGPKDAAGDPVGLLVWNPISRPLEIRERYRRTAADATVNHICVTYEDIWVFRSLFTVVQRINSAPTDVWLGRLRGEQPAEARVVDQGYLPIKRIDFCDVGRHAMTNAFVNPGSVYLKSGDTAANTGQGDDFFGTDTGAGAGALPVDPNAAAGAVATPDQALLQDRYLDARNQSVDPTKEGEAPPYAEYRQMAVQLTVLMDQRLIPVLISECANAPLPIETRQIRMRLADVDAVKSKGEAKNPNKVDEVEQLSNDVNVMIRGIVYIYTPPQADKLGQGKDDPATRDYGIPNQPSGMLPQ